MTPRPEMSSTSHFESASCSLALSEPVNMQATIKMCPHLFIRILQRFFSDDLPNRPLSAS
jgi:hypothetical protein